MLRTQKVRQAPHRALAVITRDPSDARSMSVSSRKRTCSRTCINSAVRLVGLSSIHHAPQENRAAPAILTN